MNESLKQRLVGALILVALGVVFWPIIFVEPGRNSVPEVEIPLSPAIDTSPVRVPDTAGLRQNPEVIARAQLAEAEEQATATASPSPTPVSAPTPEPVAIESQPEPEPEPEQPAQVEPRVAEGPGAGKLRTEAPEKPAIDAQGVPIAWVLQVVTVSDKAKAESLRDRLIGEGHKSFLKSIKRDGKTLYRVYTGPKFERAQLEGDKRQIDESLKVQSLITRYVP